MKTYRTNVQWQQLLQQRSDFSGTNVEFCQHHHISISNYYKHRALSVEEQSKQTTSLGLILDNTIHYRGEHEHKTSI